MCTPKNLHTYIKNKFPISILLIIISLNFHACSHSGKHSGNADYYPLIEGTTMEYSVKKTTERFKLIKVTYDYSVKTLAPRTLNGNRVIPVEYNNGNLVFLLKDKTGLYYVGDQMYREEEPHLEKVPKLIYKFPLRPGTVFRETWKPFLSKKKYDINMKYTVLEKYENVTVPAGEFKNCVHIKGKGSAILPDGKILTMEVDDWLCPDIGYVKEILEERGTFTAEGLPEDARLVTELKSIK